MGTIGILTYNLFLRPVTPVTVDDQVIRAKLLPQYLVEQDYDVLVLQEAFDDPVRIELIDSLSGEYQYRTPVLGTDRFPKQDGGVIILSRYKIKHEDSRLFGNICEGIDCWADKGVLYADIVKDDQSYHLFGTHLNSGDNAAQIRHEQILVIKSFIEEKNIPTTDPVIIAGDMNVDCIASLDEFSSMCETLSASQPRSEGHRYTYDGLGNDLIEEKAQKFIDYVLYSTQHLVPFRSRANVLELKTEQPWRRHRRGQPFYDLSDHYPLFARLEYE